MSGFMGKNVTEERIPSDIAPLRQDFAKFMQSQLASGAGLGLGAPDVAPYEELFRRTNERTFAQAKESAGNLTGSGLGNYIGRSAADASAQQSAFLADLFERSRQANATRLQNYLVPFLNTGVGPPQTQYQPGFLDYAFQGAAAAAPFV